MYRKSVAVAFASAAMGLSACAQTDAANVDEYDAALANLDTERACFFTRETQGYSNAPESSSRNERIYIDTGVDERWLLETTGPCPELDFSLRLALDVRDAGSICTGDWENLLVPSNFGGDAQRCPVRVLGRMIED